MKMFQPARKVKKSLKIVVYGDKGVGKSLFALNAPGKKAVIDTENGTDWYAEDFEFDVMKTRLYSEVKKAVKFIEQNANKYDVLIIDPITNVYQTLIDAARQTAENRAKRKGRDVESATLTQGDWGVIKQKFRSLITDLCNLQCHTVITGWMADVYEGEGDNRRKIGTKVDADKKIEHQPDVIIRLEVDRDGTRYGVIEKDRTRTYQTGQRVKDIAFSDFLGRVNKIGEVSKIQSEDEAARAEAEITDETIQAIKAKWALHGGELQLLTKQLKAQYGVDKVTGLTDQQGQELIAWIEADTQKKQGGAA
jgi:AAA domain